MFAKSEHGGAEKYARTPDSVLQDRGLSMTARCVYAVLARHVFQGTNGKHRAAPDSRSAGNSCGHRESNPARA